MTTIMITNMITNMITDLTTDLTTNMTTNMITNLTTYLTTRVTDEGQTSGQVSEHVVKISKVSKARNDTLNVTLKYKIINLMKQNPSITQKNISENLKVSLVSIKRAMKQLVDSQKISRKGGKQKGSWIIEKSKESKVHDDTLNDTLEYKIINLIKLNPSITQKNISEKLKVSLVSFQKTMKKLIDSQK